LHQWPNASWLSAALPKGSTTVSAMLRSQKSKKTVGITVPAFFLRKKRGEMKKYLYLWQQ